MADAAVTFLLEQVTDLIKGYADLISEADKEFEKLKVDLGQLKANLKDMENKPREDNLIKEIEKQIRDVVYQVEDTIDTWLTQAAAAKEKSKIRRRLAKLGPKSVNLTKEVRSLREEKVKIMLDQAMKIRTVQASTNGEDQAMRIKRDQTIRQEKVVGFEDEDERITGYLTKDETGLDVISIIGMPGLGKSTLAWKIYHSQTICYEFPIRIWVHVSQRFNSKDIFLKIIKTFTSQDMSSMSILELSQKVHACLKEEKFLLVLDDVWKTEHWDAIKDAFPFSNGKGKVLITSRHMEVGTHAQLITEPHKLRFLTKEESWKLLQLEVFGDLESCPEKLEGIGEIIAEKCAGVPLTIVVFGGILKDQLLKKKAVGLVEKEWRKISGNVNQALETDEQKAKVIEDLVELSYNMLPYDLRESFLYLGVFPEDYAIPTWTLNRLWIAEGFVQPKEGKSLEEIAEENLDDLVSRNLLMVSQINPMGEAKICRVHDMIRTFCRLRASEKNLFRVITIPEEGVPEALVSQIENAHRLCLHSNPSTFFSADLNSPHVRSFLCFQKEPIELDPSYISAIPDNFELLRILHSKSVKFNKFPQNLTNLIHLRYIILSIDDLKVLPEAISQLWNLQIIVADTKSRTLTMRANIWRMLRLRHVKTNAAIDLDPSWAGEAGKNLQTLSRVSPKSGMEVISTRACNLRTLGIRGKLATLFDETSLKKFSRLEKLKLVNDLQYESASVNRLQYFLDRNRFPPNLKRLTLSNAFLDWKHMSTLAMIGDLEVLKLKDNAFIGISWEAKDDVFKSLQYLLIVNADLVLWEASESTFPSLRCLVLKNCDKLNKIPSCIGKHLESLDIERVRKSVVESALKIEKQKEQEEQLQKGKWGVRFTLSVGPGCDQA